MIPKVVKEVALIQSDCVVATIGFFRSSLNSFTSNCLDKIKSRNTLNKFILLLFKI